MSVLQAPEDEQGGGDRGDPSRDLRSILVTSVLNLEPLDEDLFRGRHYWVPTTQRLFGGQIVGQALVAAAKSVSEDVHVHSLHCYFVRAGDPKVPVLYQVERTRTGRSFSVRSVRAVQHGKPIFIFQASFQKVQPSPVQHQFSMPTVPPPEKLLDHQSLIDQYLRDPNLQEKYRVGLNRIAAQEGRATSRCTAVWLLISPTMPSWARRCCPTSGSIRCTSWPPWTTPCGSMPPSELTTGCSTSARAPGLVALEGWSMGDCGVRTGFWLSPVPRRV
ncbi:acyl-coenzyme A thioesterase 8 isoform X4 [Heterocephalus glaber]|uniref:Acyl-coenzyme A thioesterase 8 isoform X4 n=1 Tax=Heterocephalus glaber TaxID=10181 RepID=A0AAX6PSV7_HETGA|nr:acyl-coenzyme A thioesterase 8 isoform X4 [Heterocephalus glaber]